MKEIIKDIWDLIIHIENDTRRTKLPEMSMKLIELTFILAESKREVVRMKWLYDRTFIKKKESSKIYLEKLAKDKYEKAVSIADEKDKKKIKLDKVSNIDADDFTKLEILSFVEESMKNEPWFNTLVTKLEEHQMVMVYLDPIIRSYTELINSWKHVDKSPKESFNPWTQTW